MFFGLFRASMKVIYLFYATVDAKLGDRLIDICEIKTARSQRQRIGNRIPFFQRGKKMVQLLLDLGPDGRSSIFLFGGRLFDRDDDVTFYLDQRTI